MHTGNSVEPFISLSCNCVERINEHMHIKSYTFTHTNTHTHSHTHIHTKRTHTITHTYTQHAHTHVRSCTLVHLLTTILGMTHACTHLHIVAPAHDCPGHDAHACHDSLTPRWQLYPSTARGRWFGGRGCYPWTWDGRTRGRSCGSRCVCVCVRV